uniref:Uncharacterized protein n=1 Tax=Chloropicon primus TaxID=1764295 RepID=A0A7S2T1I4_9CHLO|mmetsp:Transcript_3475/g.9754  ORF Transcript_3475/g.9754 Transcript_3475/m.9754 type:complete len:114 (+) Transcript_3475:62-403(+)
MPKAISIMEASQAKDEAKEKDNGVSKRTKQASSLRKERQHEVKRKDGDEVKEGFGFGLVWFAPPPLVCRVFGWFGFWNPPNPWDRLMGTGDRGTSQNAPTHKKRNHEPRTMNH